MDMFSEPRCKCCSGKTSAMVKDNKITIAGEIDCCFVRGLVWYLKPCCFISYICGGITEGELDYDIRKEVFNTMAKKEAYVNMDDSKFIVYQVEAKMRTVKMPDNRMFVVVNDVVLKRPVDNYFFISKKQYEE